MCIQPPLFFNTCTVEPPLIEVQPEHVSSISPGEDVSLSLLASGFYLIYQWKYADGSRLGSGFEGVNTSTLTIQDVEESGSYQCAVSNPAGTVLSYITNVTIGKSSSSQILCV